MQRLREAPQERGAVAVIVALTMVVLLTMGALAIDVSAMHSDRQQLQTGADAAALAIAQDCARGACTDAADTAQFMASANINDGDAVGTIVDLDEGAGLVIVRTVTEREHAFASIIGIDRTEIAAQATARWGVATDGTPVIPLILSTCALETQAGFTIERDDAGNITDVILPQDGSAKTIVLPKKEEEGSCTYGPSNMHVPGGFGWIKLTEKCGITSVAVGLPVDSDPGKNVPSGCTFPKKGELTFLPIFEKSGGQGNDAWYEVVGFAAFRLDSYFFDNTYSTSSPPCSSPKQCIRGSFEQAVKLDGSVSFDNDALNFGVSVVALTE